MKNFIFLTMALSVVSTVVMVGWSIRTIILTRKKYIQEYKDRHNENS